MNKNEFVDALSKNTGMTKSDTAVFVDAFVSTVKTSLQKGEDVRLVGFGTFSVHQRQATTGRNPRTGDKIDIPASKQAKFKPGKALKEVLN